MPVEPVPCAPDGGSTPGACNCSPSIATSPLCCADGSTVLLVVRSPCVTCDTVAGDPVVVGWLDPVTGIFTAGQPACDVVPCDSPDCVETVCRTLCDDTDGDGAADTTYSELWCVRADGSAELVLTYQHDPSVPYVPTAPVDCTYGCPESETVTLCDDSGPFLRRYVWLNGTATYDDYALDGTTPHVVTGTPGLCPTESGPGCPEQTTPAATLGLCLADGTPIAVVVTRDCGTGTVTQDGWINLTSGTYSAGAPPAGAQACGDSRAFELAGLLCDVDPTTGGILGMVLVEYEYKPDGSLASVRLVDPGTGSTYTLAGALRYCPAGTTGTAADLDLAVLCDVAADGTAVPFLRDYRRDPTTGQINGHTDYGLDGTPYAPTGTVATCAPDTEPCGDTEVLTLCDQQLDGSSTPFLRRLSYDCEGAVTDSVDTTLDGTTPYAITGTVGVCTPAAEECRNTSTLLVCDLPDNGEPTPTVTDTSPTPYDTGTPGTDPVTGGAAALWSGGVLTIAPDTTAASDGSVQRLRTFASTVQAPRPGCDTGSATVTASIRVERQGPDPGCLGTGLFALLVGGTPAATVGVTPSNIPVGTVRVLTVSATVPAADLASGAIALVGRLETYHRSLSACPGTGPAGARVGGWTVDEFTVSVAYDQTGCAEQVFANVVTDCETGEIQSITYALPDGTPYTPTGTIGQCETAGGGACCPQEPCRNTSTLLLCDLPTNGTPAPTVTDTPGAPYYPYTTGVPAAGAQALWDGGTLNLPAAAGPQPGTGGTVRTAAAIIQAPRPACDAGTAHVAVQVDVTQLGPDNGCRATGFLALYNGTGEANRIGLALTPPDTPVGWSGTLTVEADVPADDLAAGNIAVALAFDAYDDSGATCPPPRHTAWQLDDFAATVVYDQTGCAAQFLRNVITDCETGAVVSVTDTTLDGAPYTVTGEPGQCTASGGGTCCPQQPCPAESVLQECRCDDTDGDGIGDTDYVELLGVSCDGTLTSLGTYRPDLSAPYTPTSPVDCEASEDLGADRAFGVQAHRAELTTGASWSVDAWPTLQSVTAVAHGGTGLITTAEGASTLHPGEAATWSVGRDTDARLTGPLVIAAATGTVTITYTTGVQL